MKIDTRKYIARFEEKLRAALNFWMKNSQDEMFGGIRHCLTREGRHFSTDKGVWMQGRAGWAFSYVYNHFEKKAEYLERAIYVCPFCCLSNFYSHGDLVRCERCGREVRYTEHMTLVGEGFDFPFTRVSEWYDYQSKFISELDELPASDEPLYTDEVKLVEVIVYERKNTLAEVATAKLYADRIDVLPRDGELLTLPFSEVSAISALGRKKINVYVGKQVYQLAGNERFCGLKYVNFYYKHKNVLKGEKHGSFLGL